MPKRSVYLQDIPKDEAWARLVEALKEAGLWQPLPGEWVPLGEALGRVTAEPVWAAMSSPHYHASAMDGYAVRARDTQGASETNPLTMALVGPEVADLDRVTRPAQPVNTGHPLPPWADAVIMVEHVQAGETPGELIIHAPVAPWHHVRPMGEDMVATELVLPANHTLRPIDLGAVAGSGHAGVWVRRKPRVAILPTGSELIRIEEAGEGRGAPRPGQVIEFNSLVLAAQVEQWGGVATRWPIVPDNYAAIRAAVAEAACDHDLVLVNAGSSAGSEDYTVHVVEELGEVLVHGIAVRPGHPVVFGMVRASPSSRPSSPQVERGRGGEAAHIPQIGALWATLKPLARQKRHKPTPSEDRLWQSLRGRRLERLKFRRQHVIGRFIVDFYCADLGLVVEVDGPVHQYTPNEDAIRQEYLESLGMRVVRLTDEDVMNNLEGALARILDAARMAASPPSRPSPSPFNEEGEGEPPQAARKGMRRAPASPEREGGAARRVPVIGVPGYPVSAALTGEMFVEPLISRWLGRLPAEPPTLQAVISRKVVSPTGDDDYVRVTVGQVGQRVIATPLSRGAGVITSLVRADGIVRIPRFSEGLDAGAPVTVHLYRTPREIARTIVAIGSHDLTLDLLAQFLAERAPGARLASANVGSLGGLIALKRGEAHLAGSHLLDPETGEYNRRYVDQYLAGREIVLVTLVHREQGLIVPAGNPQRIGGFEDLAREDVTFANRQRGAGTRLLLDYELSRRGIAAEQVHGYEREEFTHLAVAAAVASGAASCGLGVRAAAQALGLDFVPVGWERYDLVIPREHAESDLLAPLLALLEDGPFRTAVAALPGYDVREMGRVVG